jgi:3-methyladenine DNA glycosylase/8-oxoguanine DNA glycosylase
MMLLPKYLCLAIPMPTEICTETRPLQAGLYGSPWHVIVASQLLCRTRRSCADSVFAELIERWPTPADLARADSPELEALLQPLGLYRNRARQLIRMSFQWIEGNWEDARELAGVGKYVADAIGLFCFGCTDLVSDDHALVKYADSYTGPELTQTESGWRIEPGDAGGVLSWKFQLLHEAVAEYRRLANEYQSRNRHLPHRWDGSRSV